MTLFGLRYILVGMKKTKNPEQSRQTILSAALKEIQQKGFHTASLTDILDGTGLTRGALYHHFPNKKALGHTVLNEIEKSVTDTWINPIKNADDPITRLQEAMMNAGAQLCDDDIIMGCPLNNLAQEMSAVDEDFRQRVLQIYDLWKNGIADAFRNGQKNGTVSKSVDPIGAALFFVAALSGGRGLAKTSQNFDILATCADHLIRYLETLRP